MQMHAFTRPSPQLRIKVREALLRSLHHSSLYRRLIVASKEKGARIKKVGQALHKKLTHSLSKGGDNPSEVPIRATIQRKTSLEIRTRSNR